MERAISRRELVAGTAAASAALAAGLSLREAKAENASSVASWDFETDVLVCGAGTGGLAAAVQAADGGAEVLVIEKMDWAGGQLRRCGGGVIAAGSQVQKALGVEDTPEALYDYWRACAEPWCDDELLRDFCMNSSSVIDWIIDDLGGEPLDEWEIAGDNGGLEYNPGPGLNIGVGAAQYEALGFTPAPRCHWFKANPDDPIIGDEAMHHYPTAGGTGLYKVFQDAVDARGIETLLETALVRLVVKDGTNEVVGAVAAQPGGEIRIKARKAVVVATGNFGSNHQMHFNFIGTDFENSDYGAYGQDLDGENDGSGIKACLALGAQLVTPNMVNTPLGDFSIAIEQSLMCGGLKTDLSCRCLDVFDEPIPRLFITSIAQGGVTVGCYPGCGSSVGRVLYFGRIAGREAAALEAAE